MNTTDETSELGPRLYDLVSVISAHEEVKAAVEANHDNNQWWPLHVDDWRIRMLVAGWSTRVSYAMVDVYAEVVKKADAHGWDALINLQDPEVAEFVRSIGLAHTRVRYLRSLETFVATSEACARQPLTSVIGRRLAYLEPSPYGGDNWTTRVSDALRLHGFTTHRAGDSPTPPRIPL